MIHIGRIEFVGSELARTLHARRQREGGESGYVAPLPKGKARYPYAGTKSEALIMPTPQQMFQTPARAPTLLHYM